jgi:hypothetical protein
MGEVLETVKTVNSSIRTGLAVVLVGGVGAGGFYGYNLYRENEVNAQNLKIAQDTVKEQTVKIEAQQQTIREKEIKISKLAAAMRALKVNRRVATIDVLEQTTDEATGEVRTRIEFQEYTEDGRERLDKPRQFVLPGELVYVDYRLVKFEDQYVEEADIDKGATLFLFDRIFSDKLAPEKGFTLDNVGERPKAYATGAKMTAFEREIWENFWTLAGDDKKAKEFGIRSVHGQANSFLTKKGKRYNIDVRASDGMSVTQEDLPKSPSDGEPPGRNF